MSTYYYRADQAKPLCWKKEAVSLFAATTTNDAGDTYFPLPIKVTKQPFIYMYRKKSWQHVPGYVDPFDFANGGYEKGAIELEGELTDLGIMYLLIGSPITYTVDTPASGYHTKHWYNYTSGVVSGGLVARAAVKPTFRMIQHITNDTDANSIKSLLVGCHIPYMRIWGRATEKVYGRIRIEFANVGAATALTTHPQLTEYAESYRDDMLAITYTKAGTAYEITPYEWWFEFNDGSMLDTASTEVRPGRVLKGPRTIKIGFDKAVWKKTDNYTDTDALSPTSASNVHLNFTLTRTTSVDTLAFDLQHLWELQGQPAGFDHAAYYLAGRKEFILKGNHSTEPGIIKITQVNTMASGRFE